MYDRKTESLWRMFTGEPVVGPLADSGIKLSFFPVELTTWGEWAAQHPDTTVLSIATGVYAPDLYEHEDDPRAVYNDYFNDPETRFPVWERSDALETKAVVLGLNHGGESRAYPVETLQRGARRQRHARRQGHRHPGLVGLAGNARLPQGRNRLRLRRRRPDAGRAGHDADRRRRDLDRHRGLPGGAGRPPAGPRAVAHVVLVRLVRLQHRHDHLRPSRPGSGGHRPRWTREYPMPKLSGLSKRPATGWG